MVTDIQNKIKIACLPVAGTDDPGQLLMMQGLNENNDLLAFSGVNDKFFGILRTAIKFKPAYIHFDWIESYYFRKYPILSFISVPLFFLQLWLCKYLYRIKIGWTLHNLLPHDKRQIQLKKFVQRKFASFTTFIRVLSPDSVKAAASLLRVDEKKIKCVPTGSFIGYYPDGTNRAEAMQKLNLPPHQKIILNLGSIKPYKGITELINVFSELDPPETLLVIAGKSYDTAYLNEIKRRLTSKVKLMEGFIEIADIQYYYHAANLVVLPFTEIENSGSILVAAGFKKAIVAPLSNVIKFRLQGQMNLLYAEGGLEDCIRKALQLPETELKLAGEKNYASLKSFQWADFGSCFITHE